MDFRGNREKLKGLLLECGLKEVGTSKAHTPSYLPAGIVSLANREGIHKTSRGYAGQKYSFEVHLIEDATDKNGKPIDTDAKLVDLLYTVDTAIQDRLFTEIDKVEFYDSLLNGKQVRIGKFEIEI